jgi:hypothetical protein
MQGMEHMNTTAQSSSSLYGVHMVEYGGDVGVGSMMALMTEHQPESESIMTSIPIPSSYSSIVMGMVMVMAMAMVMVSQNVFFLRRLCSKPLDHVKVQTSLSLQTHI